MFSRCLDLASGSSRDRARNYLATICAWIETHLKPFLKVIVYLLHQVQDHPQMD